MQTSKPTLIGSAEAAQRLSVDRSTFLRWVKDGRVHPALEVDGIRGAKFFDRADIEALANNGTALATHDTKAVTP